MQSPSSPTPTTAAAAGGSAWHRAAPPVCYVHVLCLGRCVSPFEQAPLGCFAPRTTSSTSPTRSSGSRRLPLVRTSPVGYPRIGGARLPQNHTRHHRAGNNNSSSSIDTNGSSGRDRGAGTRSSGARSRPTAPRSAVQPGVYCAASVMSSADPGSVAGPQASSAAGPTSSTSSSPSSASASASSTSSSTLSSNTDLKPPPVLRKQPERPSPAVVPADADVTTDHAQTAFPSSADADRSRARDRPARADATTMSKASFLGVDPIRPFSAREQERATQTWKRSRFVGKREPVEQSIPRATAAPRAPKDLSSVRVRVDDILQNILETVRASRRTTPHIAVVDTKNSMPAASSAKDGMENHALDGTVSDSAELSLGSNLSGRDDDDDEETERSSAPKAQDGLVETSAENSGQREEEAEDDHLQWTSEYQTEAEEASELLRLEGREVERKSDIVLARELYRKCIELNAKNGKGWQDLAKCEGRIRGGLRKSAAVLRKALEANPTNAYLWQSLGFLEYRMGQHDLARSNFMSGLECDPKHAPLYSTWARMEGNLGNHGSARDLFERGAAADPNCARLFYTWGTMEQSLGNVGRAHELFQEGLKVEPDNSYIWQTLGMIAVESGKFDYARTCFERALAGDGENIVVLDHWGRLEARLGNWHIARDLFSRGVDGSPYDARVLHSWSVMEYQKKDYAEARDLIRRAVMITNRDSILWSHFARVELALGNVPRARALFKRASEVNPHDWMTWDSWSAMEHQLGNSQESAKLLQRSFAVRFEAKGDFTVLANSISEDRTDNHDRRS